MRLTIEGTSLIDCGGTIADLGKEEYSKRYHEKSVLAHAKLGQIEDLEEKFGIDSITLYLLLEKQETNDPITLYYKRFGQIKEKKNRFIVNVRKRRVEAITYMAPLGYDAVAVQCPKYRSSYAFCEYGKTWAFTKEELE